MGKPVPANVNFSKEEEKVGFASAGAFKINEQWATAIRYEANIKE